MLTRQPESAPSPKSKVELRSTRLTSSVSLSAFHVLFNSLSKVLFIFPSRYLFTIGLSPIFSFRWNLPPILSCIPKQLDSLRAHHKALIVRVKDGILTLYDALFQETCTRFSTESTSPDYNSGRPNTHQILNLSLSRFTRSY
ncbi:hypothetical protein AcW1_005153 [Taiwanofungus camphoratus]|nr:hypothetical protein AcW1_005153 [Antrodia cinnamomea]